MKHQAPFSSKDKSEKKIKVSSGLKKNLIGSMLQKYSSALIKMLIFFSTF